MPFLVTQFLFWHKFLIWLRIFWNISYCPQWFAATATIFSLFFFWKFSIRPELITGKISSAHNSLYQTIFSSFMAKLWQNVAKSASSPRFQHSPAEDIYLQISISKNNTDCFWNKALVDTILLLILIGLVFLKNSREREK